MGNGSDHRGEILYMLLNSLYIFSVEGCKGIYLFILCGASRLLICSLFIRSPTFWALIH